MLYRRKLDMDMEETRPELNILRNACTELRTSAKFKQVLQVRVITFSVETGIELEILRLYLPWGTP